MENSDNNFLIEKSIIIKAIPSKIWNALTKGELTKKYMYDYEVKSDWKVGSSILWILKKDGKDYGRKGKVLQAEPNKILKFSDFKQQFNYKTIEPSIIHAINIIYQKNGQIKVEDLAYRVFNSKRNFERKFKAVTGLTPKKFIMNVRFQFSLQFLGNNTRSVDIGYDCGYYDQSHFINEFKSIAGITPEKILTKLCRIFPISSNIIKTPLHHKLLLKN